MIRTAIDTSVLVGLLDLKDIWHKPAIALKEALQANSAVFTIFDCVLAEAISIIARRVHEKRRVSDLNQLNDALIALSCRNRDILMLATFDRDFDQVTWLQSIAEPSDLA